ncbi:MAG TPA: hypothetical protein VFO60_12475 [Candidatus Dormibacteraeota bacterium]|nr:hypothetical protein [Candidatus Dormibacteraeota bacterium]
MTPPACTVVVAVRGPGDPRACFDALERQIGPGDEVIVVDDGTLDGCPPWARRMSAPGALAPELWALGLADARGPVVALTTSSAAPAPGWLERVRAAGTGSAAAVGGAVEPGDGYSTIDWAVYLCRYAKYMLPFAAHATPDLAGDNVAYRTAVVGAYRHIWQDGFWEPFVHAAMAADGHALTLRPDMVVRMVPGGGAREFSSMRFRHGRHHGLMRSAGLGRGAILAGALTAPLVPPLMTARAGRQVWGRGRLRARFLQALPAILWFYSCWAAGELAGRLQAVASPGAHVPHREPG